MLHRQDTRDVPVANFAETFPSKFLDSQVFSQAREQAAVIPQNMSVSTKSVANYKDIACAWFNKICVTITLIGINVF